MKGECNVVITSHHAAISPLSLIDLSVPSLTQFAQSQATDGYKLPATDGHAHRANLLLHRRGASPLPQLPDGDSENHVQPGDVRQPAGAFAIDHVHARAPAHHPSHLTAFVALDESCPPVRVGLISLFDDGAVN